MTQGSDLLRVHPVEEAFFAAVAPRPHVTVFSKCDCVVLAHGHIDDAVLVETLHQPRLLKVHTVFVPVAEHTPVTLAKRVELALSGDDSAMPHANTQPFNIKRIVLLDSLRHAFGHLEVGGD